MSRVVLVLGLVLVAGAGVSPASAQRENNRAALERQVQQQLWRVTRARVGLTDAQMRQLGPVNQKFEQRRRAILREERQTRQALRSAMLDSANSASADQSRVSAHLDRLLQLERERIDLLQEEQRELAKFMTPVQRAKYMALQEQVRRRLEQMRARGRAGEEGAPGSRRGRLPPPARR